MMMLVGLWATALREGVRGVVTLLACKECSDV